MYSRVIVMLVGVQIHYVSQIRWGGGWGWGWGVIVIMAMEGTRILAAIHKRLIHDNYIHDNSYLKYKALRRKNLKNSLMHG